MIRKAIKLITVCVFPILFGVMISNQAFGQSCVQQCREICQPGDWAGGKCPANIIAEENQCIAQCSAPPFTPIPGAIHLKYKVLGVDYAPPGARSTVTYNSNMLRGSSTTNSQSFADATSVSTSITTGAGLFGLFGGTTTTTASSNYSQESDTTNSVTISTTTTVTDVIPGPLSSASGVDHNYDVIWVWLNPTLKYTQTAPASIQCNGYAYDAQDNANEMEVVPLYVSYLQNPSTIPANVASRLARSWDTTGLGGLTSADYTAILAADPFASASYNPNVDGGHRFDLQNGQTFSFSPPPTGGQPITQTYSVATQSTSMAGKGAQITSSAGYAFDYQVSADFIAKFKADLKYSNTFTNVDKWSSSSTSGAGETASLSITGPAAADNYHGPTVFQVWRDNIYGSFMFYPVQ